MAPVCVPNHSLKLLIDEFVQAHARRLAGRANKAAAAGAGAAGTRRVCAA